MDVALAHDAEMTDDLESGGPKHVVLIVRERLRRSHDNGIAGVSAEGVKVLHVAADDRVLQGRQRIVRLNEVSILTSAASRTTSYSSSFHPFMLRSMST